MEPRCIRCGGAPFCRTTTVGELWRSTGWEQPHAPLVLVFCIDCTTTAVDLAGPLKKLVDSRPATPAKPRPS